MVVRPLANDLEVIGAERDPAVAVIVDVRDPEILGQPDTHALERFALTAVQRQRRIRRGQRDVRAAHRRGRDADQGRQGILRFAQFRYRARCRDDLPGSDTGRQPRIANMDGRRAAKIGRSG